jgi:hypothetical protein
VIEVRTFSGKMNYDDNPYRLPKGDYSDALNITRDAQGDNQDEVVSNILGNLNVLSPGTNLQYTETTTVFGHTATSDIVFSGTAFYGASIQITIREQSTGNYVLLTSYVGTATDTITDLINGLIANATGLPYTNLYSIGSDTLEIVYDTDPVYGYSVISVSITGYHYGGVSKTIGNYADKVRNRQYFFNWNDEGYNRISYYDGTNNSVVVVMEDLTDTDDIGVLNFDPSYRINHIDIVYRDEDGDLLFWTDGLNPPSKINVKTATTGAYGIIQRSYIDVAKEPPSAPPYCVYEDDASITVNNLNNKQFKFKYRFVYDDLEKSVTSAQSEVPIPYDYSPQSTVVDPTKNAYIFLAYQTGAENVTRIELLGSESQGTTWSDFYLIDVLDKTELSLNSNDIGIYKFYNDKVYNTIPLKESIQPFDLVPQTAYTQSLPNGNVLDYGAITEGYNNITGNFTTSTSYINSYIYNGGMLFLAYQNAQPAFGDGDIKIIIAGHWFWSLATGNIVELNIDDNGTLVTLSSTALNIAGIILQLSTQATAAGFTIVSSSTNELIINKNGASIITTLNESTSVSRTLINYALNNNSQFAYDWSSRYSFGVVYFDEKGRTNGVIYSQDTLIQTPIYNENTITALGETSLLSCKLPLISLEINNRPPIWASYFEIVRTKNLTKSNFLYWISENTYKDASASNDGYKYAYISIANLTSYVAANPNIKTLGYEFTPGDRISFIKLYNTLGNNNTTYTSSKDFQIVESLTNPQLGGTTIQGQVLKIILPPTDSSFDFGGSTYANYLIEIYTPSKNFSDDLNIYYEFGERYIVGNAGTNQAYHQGMLQNQTENLSQPATYEFYKGDSYFRSRLIYTGGAATLSFTPKSSISSSYYPMSSVVSNNSTHNSNYTFVNVTSGGNNQITVSNSAAVNFLVSGFIKVKSSVNSTSAYIQTVGDFSGNINWFALGSLTAGVETTINISNWQLNISAGNTYCGFKINNFNGDLIDFQLNLVDGKSIYAGIIDPNFSDNYDSSASSDGRAWKFDPNAEQSFNPTLIRFGGEFQAGTTVNDINRFYEENFDVYDRSRGSIQKMFIEGRNQYVFQQFDVGVVTVLTQIVRDTAGNPLSAQSDKLLNKIVYPYIGGYGIGNVPESFAYGKHAKFFVDNNKGVVCRLSTDGITPISILYKMNAFFVPLLANYNSNLNTTIPETGTPTVYGAYDAFTNKYIICMSDINRDDLTQDPYTIAFLDSRDYKEGFEAFYSYHPENIGALNNLLLTFKEGQVWTQNNPIHCNFYGVDYDVYIDVVFNDSPLDRKTYLAIMETSNVLWHCPSIISQAKSGNTQQSTSIVEARFSLLEGQYNAAIPRDENSPGGLINGDTMKGNYLKVRFQTSNGDGLYYLNSVSLKYINSPLNVR